MTITGTPTANPFRDIPVDILRGLAITIMVGANLIPYLLLPPVPFWLRLVSSIAAPLFVFLSGMMVALSFHGKKHTFGYFLIRGFFLILIAAFLDLVVWGLVPFIDTDVMYLIGISLPLAYVFLSLDIRARIGILVAIIAATPLLQGNIGYSPLPLAIPVLSFLQGGAFPGIFTILSQWFIDGWFPIFPWLAVALLGAEAGLFRWQNGGIISFAQPKLTVLAAGMLSLGAAFWYLRPGPALIRMDYVELFYPPTPAFIFFIIGVIFCLFVVVDVLPVSRAVLDPLRSLGECSLAIYILHALIIGEFIVPLSLRAPILSFLAVYLLFTAGLIIAAYRVRNIRMRVRPRSVMARMLIGG